LLAEAELTLKKVLIVAQGKEAAVQNAQLIKGTEPAICQLTVMEEQTRRKSCFRCSRNNQDRAYLASLPGKHQPKREKEASSVETQESVTYVTASEAQDDLELALF